MVPGRETVKPLVGDGTACSKTGADLLGNRKFESISLQRGVSCEPNFSKPAPKNSSDPVPGRAQPARTRALPARRPPNSLVAYDLSVCAADRRFRARHSVSRSTAPAASVLISENDDFAFPAAQVNLARLGTCVVLNGWCIEACVGGVTCWAIGAGGDPRKPNSGVRSCPPRLISFSLPRPSRMATRR